MIIKRKIINLFGLILIIISLLYFCSKLVIYITVNRIKEEELTTYFKRYNNLGNNLEIETKESYLMVLEIPKIKLKQGIYDKNDIRNTIDQNVSILKESIKIDNKKSLLMLAAHSGNSVYSYFKSLYKLRLNDEILIYYEKQKYIYKINHIYEMPKSNSMKLAPIMDNKIILITCMDDYNYLIIEAENT